MTLILLDPNLKDPHGHHMEWDFAIAAEARLRGEDAIIFAHRDCRLPSRDGLEIVPLFSCTTYEVRHDDKITGKFDNFSYLNDVLAHELESIPREKLRAADAVLVPTLNENHLLGYVSWMRTFEPSRAPLFVVYLMFPSGLSVSDEGEPAVCDPFQALFYKLAFRRAAEPGVRIHFFGGGRQLAREYSELIGATIEAHPVPIDVVSRNAQRGQGRPTALLFAGDAKADKGFGLVPDLADRLCAEFKDWRFLVHANSGPAWGPALQALNRLTTEIASRHENLVVHTDRLSEQDYLQLMDQADCLVSTYDPVVYARKSSGVIWEAISLGIPMLAPAQTWLEKEAKEWGAGYCAYATHSVDDICEKFAQFAPRLADLLEKSAQAAKSFQQHNGVRALINQIGRLWAPRLLAATLTPQPEAAILPLLNIEKEGWSFPETFDGQIVRWVGKAFEIEFSWPFDAPWRLDVAAARFISGDQVTGAKAFAGAQALTTSGQLNSDRRSGVVTVLGAGDRRHPAHNVRIELPWTYKPADENRELGLLVQSVSVSPGQSVENIDEIGKIEILTRAARSEQGFLLDGVVSGRAVMDPRGENWLHFMVRTDGGPRIAHAIELYVNGVPMGLDRIAMADRVWAFRAKCSPDVLAAGLWADWDLALRDRGDGPVYIDDLCVSDSSELPALAGIEDEKAASAPNEEGERDFPALDETLKSEIALRGDQQTLFTVRDIPDDAPGFYAVEPADNGSAIRWTGPSKESRFILQLDRSYPLILIISFASLGRNRVDQVSIKVDDKVYSLREDSPEKNTFCIGPIGSALDYGETQMILRVAQLMRPSEEGFVDERELGVALEWIRAERWLSEIRLDASLPSSTNA